MPESKEDKETIRSVEAGDWLPSSNSAVLKRQLRAAAKATMLKDQRMNIRIARKDMLALKGVLPRAIEYVNGHISSGNVRSVNPDFYI